MDMKTFSIVIALLIFSGTAHAQEIRTGVRVLQGLAIGNEVDTGDFGLSFSLGYDQQLGEKLGAYGALETGGNSALGTFFLADLGIRYEVMKREFYRISGRAGLLTGMMGYREDPPFLFGSSLGIEIQKTTGTWHWYLSPGIRRLQPYHPLADFASVTDLEIRLGASWNLPSGK